MRGRGGHRARRRSRVPCALGATFCVFWIGLICAGLLFGGSSEEARFSGANAEAPKEGAPAEQASAPSEAISESSGGDYAGAGGESVRSEVHTGGERAGAGSQEQKPPPAGTRLPQGASGGQAPYDPLGTGAGPDALSETDRDRARLAAFKFVDAAYDFEGSGPEARSSYVGDVDRTVDASEFWKSPQSPGADALMTTARRVEEYGVQSTAALTEFRIDDESSEQVVGTALFVLDEGRGEKTYRQRLVLRRWAAVWRVLYAREIEEVT